ncbi:MAG: M20 family metallopeptidase [Actinomycetes bacterium]
MSDVVHLRRALHRHPELGLHLPKTQAAVVDALRSMGLEPRVGDGLSSVVADIEGAGSGRTVLLRGDMDALPMPEATGLEFSSTIDGTMHACGHDAHTAMLVGAARLLVERRSEFSGTVRLMFQPGEEQPGGAPLMISEGVLDGVDAAFALHVAPTLWSGMIAWKAGPVMASSDVLTVTVSGRGGHASTPHWATDPVPVACEIVLALQQMVTRTVDVFDPAVLTIAQLDAGTTDNVIPESARLIGTLRAVFERTRRAVWERISTVADGIAAAHGCTATVHIEEGYPVTHNDARFAPFAAGVAADVLGQWHIPKPSSGLHGTSDHLKQKRQ